MYRVFDLLRSVYSTLFLKRINIYFLKDVFVLNIYLFGIILLHIPSIGNFVIDLTPFVLLLTAFYCMHPIFNQWKKQIKLLSFLFLIIILTIFLESLGVHTKIIFGSYHYGELLGFKVLEVPLIIGLNWMVVILGSTYLARKALGNIRFQNHLVPILSGIFAVFFDFFLEPVAISFNFWKWEGHEVPIQNYLAWFLITSSFSFVLLKLFNIKSNYLSRFGYATVYQLVFLIVLSLL